MRVEIGVSYWSKTWGAGTSSCSAGCQSKLGSLVVGWATAPGVKGGSFRFWAQSASTGGHHCEWIWCQLLESDWVCGHPWPVVSYWSECWGLQRPVTGVGTPFVTKSSKCGTIGSMVLHARCWNRAAGHSQRAWCQLLGVCGGRCLYLPQAWCAWGYARVFTSKLQAGFPVSRKPQLQARYQVSKGLWWYIRGHL